VDTLTAELQTLAREKNITLADETIDDVLTYALFPQVGLKFLENRNNPDAFEPVPTIEPKMEVAPQTGRLSAPENYSVSVDGKIFEVIVAPGGEIKNINATAAGDEGLKQSTSVSAAEALNAPLAGNIFKVLVSEGDKVEAGDVVIIMEAMKMETEIRAVNAGEITALHIREGDSVTVGQALLSLG
jgi:oxaloacetate decarboxylase alpha subunit